MNPEDLSLNTDWTKNMVNNERMADFTLKSSNGDIFAHRFLLCVKNDSFYRNLWCNDEVTSLDFATSYDVLLEFVTFIYTDVCTLSDVNALELMKLACEFKVEKLISLCTDFIVKNIHLGNVCTVLDHSLIEDWPTIQLGALELVGVNITKLIECDDSLLTLKQDTIQAIFDFEMLADCTELDLFKFFNKWAVTQLSSTKKDVSGANKRKIFGNLINSIRFPILTVQEFAHCINVEPDVLTKDEIIGIFQNIAIGTENNFGFLDYARINPNTLKLIDLDICEKESRFQSYKMLSVDRRYSLVFQTTSDLHLKALKMNCPKGNIEMSIAENSISIRCISHKCNFGLQSIAIGHALKINTGNIYEINYSFTDVESGEIGGYDFMPPYPWNVEAAHIAADLVIKITKLPTNINSLWISN